MKYSGRKAVVTGGTHGIGLAVVRALVAEGADVVATGRDAANLEAARIAVPDARFVASDAASLADIDELASHAAELDLVFVNVGFAALGEYGEPAYDRTFDVNTKGAFFTVHRLAPLVKPGGAIVLTTSVATGSGNPGMTAYAGAKAAVRAFARGFAAELAPRGIRVNTVSPGFIDTPSMGVTGLPADQLAAFRKLGDERTPLRRHGTPDEVAAAVLFLAFEATFTTGSELAVDGGLGERLAV